jgi:hypothetical protein
MLGIYLRKYVEKIASAKLLLLTFDNNGFVIFCCILLCKQFSWHTFLETCRPRQQTPPAGNSVVLTGIK